MGLLENLARGRFATENKYIGPMGFKAEPDPDPEPQPGPDEEPKPEPTPQLDLFSTEVSNSGHEPIVSNVASAISETQIRDREPISEVFSANPDSAVAVDGTGIKVRRTNYRKKPRRTTSGKATGKPKRKTR